MSQPRRSSRAARSIAALVALGLLAVGHGALAQPQNQSELNKHPMANRLQAAARDPRGAKLLPGVFGPNGIKYHNGPVIHGRTNAYVIWYGTWAQSATPGLVQDFLSHVGGSPYFNINTTYTDTKAGVVTPVKNDVFPAGTTTVPAYRGTTLSDAGVQGVVADAIANNSLPKDTNGVYFVLTSAEIGESSGFLTQYCGWHTSGTISGADIKYAFIGDASKNLSACAGQTAASPNTNPAGDAMISVIAHELEEAVTDPDLNAWYDFRGQENADKCAWNYGTTYPVTDARGITAKANMTLGSRNYLIQQNWLNAKGGVCAVKYP